MKTLFCITSYRNQLGISRSVTCWQV